MIKSDTQKGFKQSTSNSSRLGLSSPDPADSAFRSRISLARIKDLSGNPSYEPVFHCLLLLVIDS